MDPLSLGLAIAAAVSLVVAFVLWRRFRALSRGVDDALIRIGVTRSRRMSRATGLGAAVEQMDSYISHSERDRAQLVAAMEAADIGIMITNDSGVVSFVNAAAKRYIGARHGETVAEARLRGVLDQVIASRSAAAQDLELYTPIRRVLRLRALPVDYGVESLGAVLFIEDLTEERRVDAVRRDFVANVGHELQTPLAAMSILAETLADTEDQEVRAKLSDRMITDSRQLAALVGDLLDLSQVESFGASPEPIPVNVVVSEAAGKARAAAEALNIEIVLDSPGTEAAISGEKRQLVTALSNLLDNAVKNTVPLNDEPGKVLLRTRVDANWVEIEVEDHGIGIPETHLDRIFERFYRVDRARSRAGGGTGLGLSIVRHVVLNHGGEIAVASEEGVGTTFTLRLPRWQG